MKCKLTFLTFILLVIFSGCTSYNFEQNIIIKEDLNQSSNYDNSTIISKFDISKLTIERLETDGRVYIKNSNNLPITIFNLSIIDGDNYICGGLRNITYNVVIPASDMIYINSNCNEDLVLNEAYSVVLITENKVVSVTTIARAGENYNSNINVSIEPETENIISIERLETDGNIYVKNHNNHPVTIYNLSISEGNNYICKGLRNITNNVIPANEIISIYSNCDEELIFTNAYDVVLSTDSSVISSTHIARAGQNYNSNINVTIELEPENTLTIERLEVDGSVYIKNHYNTNLTISNILIKDFEEVICNGTGTVISSDSIGELDFNCNINLTREEEYNIVVFTQDGIYSAVLIAR